MDWNRLLPYLLRAIFLGLGGFAAAKGQGEAAAALSAAAGAIPSVKQ